MQLLAGRSAPSVFVLALALLSAQRGPALATRRSSRGPVDADVSGGPDEAEAEEASLAEAPGGGSSAAGEADEADAPGGGGGAAGGGGGGLDVAGLQRSLRDGGVEGLNKMLKAFQAMGSLGSASMAAHIKKDADGNDVYDFRDLDETGGATTGSGPARPTVAAPLQPDLAPPGAAEQPLEAPRGTAAAAGQRLSHGAARPQKLNPQEVKASKQTSAPKALSPVRAAAQPPAPKEVGLPPEKEKPVLAADPPPDAAPLAAPEDSQPPAAPSAPAAPAARAAPAAPAAAAAASLPAAGSGAAAKPQVLAAASASADGSAGQLAAIVRGLEEVRRGVDTLVTNSLHNQGSVAGTPAPRQEQRIGESSEERRQKQRSGESGEEGRQLLSRLEDMEHENTRLQDELHAQAHRLDAVEAAARREDRRLDEVVHENKRLQDELMMVQRHKALLGHHSRRHGGSRARTFFHSKDKPSLNAAGAHVVGTP